MGPRVSKIPRLLYSNDRGANGNDVASFPTFSDSLFIPHRFNTHLINKVRAMSGAPAFSDRTQVDSFTFGDPGRG